MKRIMQLLAVVLAIGALVQTVANAVERQERPAPKETTTHEKSEPGI